MKQCQFCTNNIRKIDYKDTETLWQYLNNLAKILPKKETYLCSKHQRQLTSAIKRARILGLLPFVGQ